MAGDEYHSVISGGLKLKGSRPSGVSKKKGKKDKERNKGSRNKQSEEERISDLRSALGEEGSTVGKEKGRDVLRRGEDGDGEVERGEDDGREEGEGQGEDEEEEEEVGEGQRKTEAERRWEEMRRRRLDERLKKEGVKTHKQRVEELNKYLSNLSEHHDMPRIGPG